MTIGSAAPLTPPTLRRNLKRARTQSETQIDIESMMRRLAALEKRNAELEQTAAWSAGRRGNGIAKVPGFTARETEILRVLAARERVVHENEPALYRHISNIRKKIREQGLAIDIKTDVGLGYDLLKGRALLKRMLEGEPVKKRPALKAPARTLNLEHAQAQAA